jgi:hypothetical protein
VSWVPVGMTNSSDEHEGLGIRDDQLPEDLQPGDDNPLAEGLDAGETAGDIGPGELLKEGKAPDEQDGDSDDDDSDEGED